MARPRVLGPFSLFAGWLLALAVSCGGVVTTEPTTASTGGAGNAAGAGNKGSVGGGGNKGGAGNVGGYGGGGGGAGPNDDCNGGSQMDGMPCKTEGATCAFGGTSAYIEYTCTNGHWVGHVIQYTVAVGVSSSSTGN